MFPELSDTAQIAAWSKLQSITCTIMSTNNLQKLVSTCKINTNVQNIQKILQNIKTVEKRHENGHEGFSSKWCCIRLNFIILRSNRNYSKLP